MATAAMNLQVKTSNRQILSIALPIAAAIVVPQINFITNNIFLSGLGEKALGIAGITGVYYLIFAVIGIGLNNGLQALISRRAGENKIDEIGNLFMHGIWVALGFAFCGILITWFIAPLILTFSLRDEGNIRTAISFLNIRILGLPLLFLYQMRNALLVGTNNSKLLVWGTASEAIINVFFDYTLIYGKWGMPKLGFNGAAYASIIAEAAGLLVIFIVIHFKGINKQLHLFKNYSYNWVTTRLILTQSTPLILQHAISIITWEFFYILIEHHGDRALAISNTMRNMFGFFGCFTWAFASTTNTMVSNIIGQGMQDKVHGVVWKIIRWSSGFSFVVFVLLNLFPEMVLGIYNQGPIFVQEAIPVLRIVSLAMMFMSVSTVWMNAVTGSGNSKMTLIAEIIAIAAYSIYVYLVLEVNNMSIVWGWASEIIYWISILVPCYWFMHTSRWKNKKI